MVNQFQNPLQAIATTGRQINESINQTLRSLGDTATSTVNALLQAPAAGFRGLPFPGAQAGAPNLLDPLGIFAAASNPRNRRGNPNGLLNGGLLPTGLIPRNALQAFAQIEDVILPPGIQGPTRILLQATRPVGPVVEEVPTAPAAGAERFVPGVEGAQRPAAARRVGRMLGVTAV